MSELLDNLYKGTRMLEPNTYECPIRTIRTYWAEILIFD